MRFHASISTPRLPMCDGRFAKDAKGSSDCEPRRRAELKLAQLTALTPEAFEEFVAEVFEALGFEVEQTGGTNDEGTDLRLKPKALRRSSSASTTNGGSWALANFKSSSEPSTTPAATRVFLSQQVPSHLPPRSLSPIIPLSSSTVPDWSNWFGRL